MLMFGYCLAHLFININTTQAKKQVMKEWIEIRFDWIMNILQTWLLKPSWKVCPALRGEAHRPIMEPMCPCFMASEATAFQWASFRLPGNTSRASGYCRWLAPSSWFNQPRVFDRSSHRDLRGLGARPVLLQGSWALVHPHEQSQMPKKDKEGTFSSAARLSWLSWVVIDHPSSDLKSFR